MNYDIRKIRSDEYNILNKFLYHAIFIPEGIEPPPESIILQPELQVYVKDFGSSKHDIAFVAVHDSNIIGAVWVRIMDDYGHIDDYTPSLAISVLPDFRNMGIGTALMIKILDELKNNYEKVSLSVQKENYAVKMYKKLGFETVSKTDEEFIMVCNLK
ncbi:MAG: GNAT family N-acetyltransferase [Ruminococcus sp.]|nr:GNAT family N-acetyltransferase [Ruminococcus sp.]